MSSVERKVVAISIVQIGKLRFGYAGLHDTVTQETHVWFGKVLFQIQYLEEIRMSKLDLPISILYLWWICPTIPNSIWRLWIGPTLPNSSLSAIDSQKNKIDCNWASLTLGLHWESFGLILQFSILISIIGTI